MFRVREMFRLSFRSQSTSAGSFEGTNGPVRDVPDDVLEEELTRSPSTSTLRREGLRVYGVLKEVYKQVQSGDAPSDSL